MGISLFTSRVILEKLGIDNFGIYQSVGGIVGLMTFINGALSTGTSRFITFALGTKKIDLLKKTFSSTFTIQLILIVIIFLAAETIGLWFVKHELVIPAESYSAAIWAYHISIFTTLIGLLTVPFNAAIIAHERMDFFAYMSIFDVSAKLGIVYLLTVGNFNRLIFYAFLLLVISLISNLINIIYCLKKFPECNFKIFIDKKIFKEVAGFSGWSLFASVSIALNSQGILVLLNMFFSPVVVTARAISLQVNGAATQFVSNFRTAVNPQIVKQYASGNIEESKSLLLDSTKFSFYMMYILSLPIFLGAKYLLHIWLKDVPDYTVIFLQLVMIQSLFQVFDTSFYTALYAMGNLKLNALISPTIGFISFPIVYVLFKFGASPVALSWASLITYAILGIIVKPILIVKIAHYTWQEILKVLSRCLLIGSIAGILSWGIITYFNPSYNDFVNLVIITSISLVISISFIYFIGLDKNMRKRINTIIFSKFKLLKSYNQL